MNKDLDERLIPNGQYRDASNVQVSTSEGADVGAVENILGNSLKNIRIDSAGTTTWPIAPSGFGLTGTTCIGSAIDTQNEKIYWFITSTTADIIFEYDQILNVVNPILVDPTGAILNFNANNRYQLLVITVLLFSLASFMHIFLLDKKNHTVRCGFLYIWSTYSLTNLVPVAAIGWLTDWIISCT